jgi:hypothetical protein
MVLPSTLNETSANWGLKYILSISWANVETTSAIGACYDDVSGSVNHQILSMFDTNAPFC